MTRIPPTQYHYKKGTSGNPAGRPKRQTVDLQACLRKALLELYTIDQKRKKIRLSAFEIIIKNLVAKAMKGDYRSTMVLLELAETHKLFDEERWALRRNSAYYELLEAFKKDTDEWDEEEAQRKKERS